MAADAVQRARAEAETLGLSNARFGVLDVATRRWSPSISSWPSTRPMTRPSRSGVLHRVYAALTALGPFDMVEFTFASDVGDNLGNRPG